MNSGNLSSNTLLEVEYAERKKSRVQVILYNVSRCNYVSVVETDRYSFLKPIPIFEVKYPPIISVAYVIGHLINVKFKFAYRPIFTHKVKNRPIISVGWNIGWSLISNLGVFRHTPLFAYCKGGGVLKRYTKNWNCYIPSSKWLHALQYM